MLCRVNTCDLYISVLCVWICTLWKMQHNIDQTVCNHTEWSSRRSTPSSFTTFWTGNLIFSCGCFDTLTFLLLARALTLDRPWLLLSRNCFMLIKIIAPSFTTYKIAIVIWWEMYLLKPSLARLMATVLIGSIGYPKKLIQDAAQSHNCWGNSLINSDT